MSERNFAYPRTAREVTSQMLALPAEELQKLARHPLEIFPTRQALYEHLARFMADQIKANHAKNAPTRLILPIGPKAQYPILARITNEERISWKNVFLFHMDDWLDWQARPLPMDHPFSLKGYAQRHLYDLIDKELLPPKEQIVFPDPFRLDEFSEKIARAGGVDITFAGFGYRGHLAFNESPNNRWQHISPEEFAGSKTRIIHLLEDTLIAHSQRSTGGCTQIIPQMAITCGMADILASKMIYLLTDGGPWKQWILRVFLLTTEPDSDHAITLCHRHSHVRVACDAASAAPIELNL